MNVQSAIHFILNKLKSHDDAIDTLNSKLAPVTNSTLLTGDVTVSGTASWNTPVTGTIDLTAYNWIYVQAGVSGAAYQSLLIYAPAMIKAGRAIQVLAVWNDGNRCAIEIASNGAVIISSKTQNFKALYHIIGVN